MCGIIGVVNPSYEDNYRALQSGLSLLHSRGPDFHALKLLSHRKVGLGHARLSIIDTSSAGNQPLSNEGDTLWITFNGEIYNYLELREDLEKAGHRFKTQTDTEVLLYAYEQWGEACTSKLRGIYAFAIYSTISNKLFIARDPAGTKPLYYSKLANKFAFASTPTAVLAALSQPREVDETALIGFLWYGNVPGAHCIYKNVNKLEPGCSLFVGFNDSSIQVSDPLRAEIKSESFSGSGPKNLYDIINEALILNQRSDVPVAYFLSGGLDSSIICSLAQNNSDQPIPTFSVGFDNPDSDETKYAKHASAVFGTDHFVAFLTYQKALQQLPDVASSFDEPFHINGLIPFTYLCKTVRNAGYKVAIGGDGADELFGGYLWHSEWWEKKCRATSFGFRSLARKFGRNSDCLSEYLRIFLRTSGGVNGDLLQRFSCADPAAYLSKSQRVLNGSNAEDRVKYPLQVDQKCFLPDHCLPKVDRCSMHYGLEVRVPFLDQDVMSFASLHSGRDINPGFQRKYLLKKHFAGRLPKIDLDRKKGFSSPLIDWWNRGLDRVADYSFEQSELFQSSSILRRILVIAKTNGDIRSLVTLFSLALWADCWIQERRLQDPEFLMSI